MAINFAQDNAGVSQTLLRRAFDAQVSLPYTMCIWANPEGAVAGTQLWGINNNLWGNSGNGYFLEIVSAGAGLSRFSIAIRRTFFGPDFHSESSANTFSNTDWLPIVVKIYGSGITPTSMELHVDGALEATLTPDGLDRPFDTFPYIHVGGYWATGVGATGDTAYHGCAAHNALYSTLWTSDQITAFSNGVLPRNISAASRIYDLPMLTRATAGTSLVGDDFEIMEDIPLGGVITDCVNAPPILAGGSTSVRIMG
jgi:hypothetical protein